MPGGKFTRDQAERIFAAAAHRQQQEKQHAEALLSLDELEEAAREAGIDSRHVRAAAADVLRPSRTPHLRTFLGLPVEIRESRLLGMSADSLDWAAMVRGLRKLYGKQGVTTDLGTVREWTSDTAEGHMPIRVVVEPEGRQTRVTIERKTWPSVTGMLSGVATLLAVSLIIVGLWISGGVESNVWISGLVLGVSSLTLAGVLYGLMRRDGRRTLDRFDKTHQLVEAAKTVHGSHHLTAAHELEAASAARPAPFDVVDTNDDRDATAIRKEQSRSRTKS